MNKQWISILIVGIASGTAWAIRGQFGHEQGAAWAGGIGALALVFVSQRKDWYAKMLIVALSGAIGWGAGGMISYGQVVGYGRSVDFLNAAYGLIMLFIIGSLFGLLGGGLVGLTLDSSKIKTVSWGSLIAEMTAGGVIAYYFLINQLEILMTPPRSEAWAVCLGAGLAMIWFMVRKNHYSPLRVALYAATGAGFGFAFGNFLQILGNILAINFNMWNVMEYSIGFFGGGSMAYGIFSSKWPTESLEPEKWENKTAFLSLFIFIPFLVFMNSPLPDSFFKSVDLVQTPNAIPRPGSIISMLILIMAIVAGWLIISKKNNAFDRKSALLLFCVVLLTYILISYIVTGAFIGQFHLNHHLYVLNFIVVLILAGMHINPFFEHPVNDKRWVRQTLVVLVIILFLAYLLINIHGEMEGAHERFRLN